MPAVGRLLLVMVVGAVIATALALSADLAFDTFLGGATEVATTVSTPWKRLLSTLSSGLIIGAIGIGFLLAAALVYRCRPSRLLSTAPRFRWPLLILGFAIFATLQILSISLSVGIGSSPITTFPGTAVMDWALLGIAGLLVCIPFVIGEEIMFRAWLVREKPSFNRRTMLLVIFSSVIFAAVHLTLDPLLAAMHFVSGLAYAWAIVRLGGVEFAIGAHLGRNTIVEILMTAPDRKLPPEALDAALTANIVASLVLLLSIEVLARRRVLQA